MTSSHSAADRRGRRAVTLAFLANGLAVASFLVRVPNVRDELALREATLGLVLSGLAVGVVLGLVLSGVLAARYGSRRLTLGGAVVMIALLPGAGLAPDPVTLVLLLIAIGAAGSTMDVGMNAQGVGIERAYGRSIMLAFHGAWSVGALAAAVIGSAAMGLEVPVAFHLAGISVVLAGLVLAAARDLRVEDRVASPSGPRFALPRGPLLPLALIAFAAALGESTAADWSGIHLADQLQVAPGRIGWGFVASTAAMTTIRLLGDRLVRRVGPARVVVIGGAFATAGYLTIAISSSLPLTLVAFAAVGGGLGVTVPLVFAAAGTRSASPGAGVAAVATVGYLAFVVGPPIVGLVADLAGLRISFALVAVTIGLMTLRRHPELAPVGAPEPTTST
ncbi:MAG: MFS transporter [Nitriliruptoraceae bacterium]